MNNKGFTTVEVLICFVIVSVIMMSLFQIISVFNEKKIIESYRARIYEYKNTMTNMIQEDLVKRGLTYAKVDEIGSSPAAPEGKTYIVNFTFKDGTNKKLAVHQRFTKTAYRIYGSNQDDDFYIEYGDETDMIRYDLPDLGETKGYYSDDDRLYIPMDADGKCHTKRGGPETSCLTSRHLQINNVNINITNENDINSASHVLNIYIGFYHPELGNKYAINIIAPIDYQSSLAERTSPFQTDPSNRNTTSAIYYPA